MKDHRLIDERSLAFGRLIAERLRENPRHLDRTPEHPALVRDNPTRRAACFAGMAEGNRRSN